MNVVTLSDHGARGGAAIAANRLAGALTHDGVTIDRVYRHGPRPPAGVAQRCTRLATSTRVRHRLRALHHCELTRSLAQRAWVAALDRHLARTKPDVVHLHNLHAAGWDIEIVDACLQHAPVVWTLHDMWAVTGSCAYSMGCTRYLRSCDERCPEVGAYPVLPPRMIEAAHRRRQALFAARPRLTLVAPSKWLADVARRAVDDAVEVRHIANPIDLTCFAPRPRAEARQKLGITDDRPVLLAAAAALDSPRKGVSTLLAARKALTPHWLVLVGRSVGEAALDADVRSLGALHGDDALADAYAAADMVVHPSLADNEPLVVREALACARPVLAHPVGGLPELVADDRGWLTDGATEAALRSALSAALGAPSTWTAKGRAARAFSEVRGAPEATVGAYRELLMERAAPGL